MTTPVTSQQNAIAHKYDENILVVQRTHLFPDGAWHGLKQIDFAHYTQIIQDNKEFLPRTHMELDPRFKQIIPYLVFEHEGRYFLMQRQAKASEQRLKNKFTLGIGGHVREEDLTDGASIFDWAKREFHEEVDYSGSLTIKPLGILNDDSNEVGQVHIGFVLLLQGDSDQISIKSELKSGNLVSIEECAALGDALESWSQEVVNFLKK
ncbi:MAG: hypothetical protein NTX86_01025 [Candidatus Dependentiae bacterium]|nr:hypothetical protein [Candidatus Dependentiae bacterium]